MTYFCFFNQLELRLESKVHPTYTSLVVSYQVLHGLTKLWFGDLPAIYVIEAEKEKEVPKHVRFISINLAYQLLSYLYNFKVLLSRYLLYVGIEVLDTVKHYDVRVSIFDGPYLVNSSYLHEMDKFTYL